MLGRLDEETHIYYDNKGKSYPSVSFILEHFGISDIEKVRNIVGDKVLDRAADFGRELHRTTVLDDQNKLAKCDQGLEPYLIGWRQYVADHKPNFIAFEIPLISTTWDFAGMPDRVIDAGKWIVLPDIKTGVKTVAEEIQTAMYAILVEEHFCKQVKDRYSVHVKEFGYKIERHEDKGDFVIAKSLLTLLRYKRRRGMIKWGKDN